ncbi:MAG: hypothetical protein STSR0007_07450 [Thermovirga sp.]
MPICFRLIGLLPWTSRGDWYHPKTWAVAVVIYKWKLIRKYLRSVPANSFY